MSDKYSREILRLATAQICQNVGYTSTMVSALDVMQEVLYRIILELGRDLKLAAEHCNRRRPNLCDVVWTLKHCQIDLKALHDYLMNVESLPPAQNVPRYPVCKPEDPEYWKPKDLQEYIQQNLLKDIKNEEEYEKEIGDIKIEEEKEEDKDNEENLLKNIKEKLGGVDLDAIENDAKNCESLEKFEKQEVSEVKKKGRSSDGIIPKIIFKLLNKDVPPPPTPPPAPPTPPPAPPTTPPLAIPPMKMETLPTRPTTPIADEIITSPVITANDNDHLEQQQQHQQQQQIMKKYKKQKIFNDVVVVGDGDGDGETTINDDTTKIIRTTTNENKNNDEKSIAAASFMEKKKKNIKKALKLQQQQELIMEHQQKHMMIYDRNMTEFEKLQKKKRKKKLLEKQNQLFQQQQQQQEQQSVGANIENYNLYKQQQQTQQFDKLIDNEEKFATTNHNIDILQKNIKLENEYAFQNKEDQNILFQQQRQQQQQQQLNSLPLNLPTGTTITPAPPIMPTTNITNSIAPPIKVGKKRGRKPGSKNQPKIPLTALQQQQQQMLVLHQQQKSYGSYPGENYKITENLKKLFSTSMLPHPHMPNTLMGMGSAGAIDLTTNPNFLQHQQQQSQYNHAALVPFNPAHLYPYAATARPGLIPGGGVANSIFFPPPQQQHQQPAAMEFLQQYKQLQQQHKDLQQQQQQQQNLSNTTTVKSNSGICNIPPLLPDNIILQQQQQQQTIIKNTAKNLQPSETIDLLSDDSNEHEHNFNEHHHHHQQQQQPQQQQQQQFSNYKLQEQNHIKNINNKQDMMLISKLQHQQQQQQHTTIGMPSISKLAGGADLIPLTNTGISYSSQNIPPSSLTACGGVSGVASMELGDITITTTTTTSTNLGSTNNELQQQHDSGLMIKKNKHKDKKDKKLKKIKDGKINKKQKKEKKEKNHHKKQEKFEKILKQQQQQKVMPCNDIILNESQQQQQQQQQQQLERNLFLKKQQKREKKKEKQRRLAETKILEEGAGSTPNTSNSPLIPKLTLKLPGKNSPITTAITSKDPHSIRIDTTSSSPPLAALVQREYSPELAKFSPLVTRPPKQKAPLSTASTPPPSPQVTPVPLVVPPPPPSYWTSGDTFPASSVLLPSQLFGCPEPNPVPPPPPKELASTTSSASAEFLLKNIKPHSYVDEDGHMIWICPACGKVDDGSPMIGCDGCDAWYHWACVGITVAPKQNEDWFCRVCIVRNSSSIPSSGSAVPSLSSPSDGSKKRKRTKKK